MALLEKLKLHLADRPVTWRGDLWATWEDGAHALVAHAGPLTAADLLDARMANPEAHLTVVHEGAPTPVAVRAAARFRVTLLDAATLPEPPAPALAPPAEPLALAPALALTAEPLALAPALALTAEPLALAPALALEDTFPLPDESFFASFELALVREALEAAASPEPLLLPPSAEEVRDDLALVAAALDADLATDAPLEAPVVEAAPASATVDVHVDAVAPLATEPAPAVPAPLELVVEPALPWALAPAAEPEVAALAVTADELAALPWHVAPPVPVPVVAPIPAPAPVEPEDEHELLPAGRATRGHVDRPTLVPELRQWGLPWPRPVAPTDGLAIADPALWHAQERIQAMREGLDAKGGSSFGAVRPEGSAWLKRIQTYG